MFRTLLTISLLAVGAAQEAKDDPIGRKLSAAVKEYKTESAKVLKTAGDNLEKAEVSARRKGDLSAITKIKAERKGLEEGKELPTSAAAALRKRLMTLQAKVEAAHQQAIRDYTRAEDDKRAAETKQKLAELQAGFIGVVQLTHKKTYRIVNKNSGLALTLKSPQEPKDSKLIQAPIADDPHQIWTASAYRQGEGYVYSFTNLGCRMAIGIDDASRNPGGEMVVWPEYADMRWEAAPRQGGVTLRSIYSGLLMSIADQSKEPGGRVIQWSDQKDDLGQVWLLIEVDARGR